MPITFSSDNSNAVTTAQGSNQYTLQFWVFAYNFNTLVSTNFQGLTVIWNLHTKIDIVYASGAWKFNCYPIYDSSNIGTYTSFKQESFTINAWNFVSCAANLNTNPYSYYAATNQLLSPTMQTLASNTKPTLTATSLLSITDNTTYEWGVLFMRQLRLWNYCYNNVSFLWRVYYYIKFKKYSNSFTFSKSPSFI